MSRDAWWRAAWARLFMAVFVWCVSIGTASTARAAIDPAQGPGGPILVITSGSSPYSTYYAEILRTEGFNAFAVADIGGVSASTLSAYDVVVLSKMVLSSTQATMLTNWVNNGGNLIAMAPDPQLNGLLGLTPAGGTLSNAYLQVDTSTSVGNGIVSQTLQFHGTATAYSLSGATRLATLYSNATTATANPAVTLRNVGSGKAAAFAYDLATSIVYTRQGNPAWAAQERDGFAPIRSDDKFFGARSGDVQPDWVDLNKVAIPQADEQQRLLANLILGMNGSKKPLPRFWYFPRGEKAVVIMTGDDHGNGGTVERFNQFKSQSPSGCSVADWECVRGTSYVYTATPMTDAQAGQFVSEGFEVGLHVTTNCADYSQTSLQGTFDQQVPEFLNKYRSVGPLLTQRHHCIVWSDWSSGAQVQLSRGMRLDTSYYFWPPGWVGNVPGLFTGSAMPMRFARLDGSMLDVYMAATQMTDESGQTYPFTVDTLLDRAVGSAGYYGAYTVNAHTDLGSSSVADAVVASAKARGVPIVSARQMLTWLDARNASSFGGIGFNAGVLSFTITRDPQANGLQAMLPVRFGGGALSTIHLGTTTVPFTTSVVKGVEYAFFTANAGSYTASYSGDTGAPTVASRSPAPGATGVGVDTSVTATFSEEMDAATLTTSTFELRNASNVVVTSTVSYDGATRTATLRPASALAASSTYTATVRGGSTDPRAKDTAGNALAASVTWSFTTGSGPTQPACPCSAWSATTTPTTAAFDDPGAVELGVKFRANVAGLITGLRFYKGSSNTGTHVGNLWTSNGSRLATATFSNETATGWQQVNFATPVAISANVVYVASYYAPNGHYAADGGYFASAGVDNGPIHLMSNGESGGNGVYVYASSSSFPSQTFNATNYWVDVVFTPSTGGGGDTTAPTVTSVAPAQGATNVATAATVTATFSEAMDAASITASSFELRNASNTLVAASVSYDTTTRTARLTPSAALAASASYTATVRGGTADPRVKDLAGNVLAANLSWSFTTAASGGGGGGCTAPPNPVVAENCLPGNPASEWDVSGAGDPSIQGFATDISVNRGSTVSFKVNTNATNYRFDIYRLGFYNGAGARKVASITPSAALPQQQPACLNQGTTGLIDCGNWATSASWAVPATATSGIYFAKVIRADTGGASHIVFIVRDDASTSPLLFQTSDTTWQAYNAYGGNSLYTGAPVGRAYKVSYNRPFNTRAVDNGQDWLFNAEYPMVRWLEGNGYHVSYTTGVDSDRRGDLIRNHRVFLSVGHDEYWSGTQRANVTAARNAGVHLAFLSGNEVFWKTRWEASIDGSNTPHRTLVSYKETHANAKIDPSTSWTGTWRDPRFSPPSDGGRPENELTGTLFMVNDGATTSIAVPGTLGRMRFWRNTSVATLADTSTATLPSGTLGYEWDVDADNASRPAGLVRLSTTTVNNAPMLQDYGSTYAPGTATHAMTLYKHASGALVFGAGTVQWAWGLDATHDRAGTPADVRMQQAMVNLYADMGVQPGSLRTGLVAASASTDSTAPTSTITSPTSGSSTPPGTPITIRGTASDSGGAVGGVEVSVDGGTTWRRATGLASWSFNWTPSGSGTVNIRSRAVDDSGNIETPSGGVNVTLGAQACPCTLFSPSAVPGVVSDPDTAPVNLGVRFTSEQSGFITGIRFYKGSANTGIHVGSLWTSSGALLASATFTNETVSGWQQVNFSSPVAVNANTVYVASYFAPNGRYAADTGFFATGTDNPPLHAPSANNGVYQYASTSAFPNSTFQSTNYWVDVVFTPGGGGGGGADTTAPTVTAISPAGGASGVSAQATVSATFSENMDPATIGSTTFELRNAAGTLVPATVAYNATTRVATLTPSAALAAQTQYTATVRGGSTDPRVKDLAGNALAAARIWSFTTAAASADTTAPTVTAIAPADGATRVNRGVNITATFSEDMDPATIHTGTFELRDASNALVSATVSYSVAARQAILNPASSLAPRTRYTLTVKGGTADPRVKDLAGNALAVNRSGSFTTR